MRGQVVKGKLLHRRYTKKTGTRLLTRVAALPPARHPIPAALHFLTFGVFYRNKANESERRNLLCWVACSSSEY
jgi:hypothetical protein